MFLEWIILRDSQFLRQLQSSFNCHPHNFQIIKQMTTFEWTTIEPPASASRPGPRWGHSCCVVDENLYLFGGFANSNYMNDLWVYELKAQSWREVASSGDVPEARSNATLNYDAVNHQLILFGGGGPNKQRFNSVCILDLNSLQWMEFPPFQNEPSPWERTYHTSEFKFPYLVVFGGQGVDDLGDLWVYNLETLSWKQIKLASTCIRPKARRFHSSCMIDNSMFVFGGCEGKYICLNDLFRLDLTAFLHSQDSNDLKWEEVKLNGSEISPRWGQTSHHFNGQIYVFGGRGAEDLQDLFSINPATGAVRQIKADSAPQPRRRHSGGFVGGCLILFGGFDGNYFNDLFYVNLYRNRYQKDAANEQYKVLNYHDYDIFSFNKLKVSINTALIGKYFDSLDDMLEFLNAINDFYLIQELQVAFQTLYDGYGKFPIEKIHRSLMKFEPTECYPAKHEILEQLDIKVNGLLKISQANQGKAIQLQASQLTSYIKSVQLHWQNDHGIKLNNFQVLYFNEELLCQSSKFFDILLAHHFKEQECTPIQVESCSWKHLALIFAFLHTKFLVIPKVGSYEFLIEICRLAEYFVIPSLMKACEEELSLRVSSVNCQELSAISAELGLEYLSQQCSLLTLNELMMRKVKSKSRMLLENEEKMLDGKTLKLYKEIQFDLAHQKSEIQYSKYSKSPLEQQDAFSNKENCPTNGLPRKTSNHFQK